MRLRARWLFPGDGKPIPDAVVTIKNGTIIEVSKSGDAIDLGDVAIIPGLINAHTHLEFSSIETPLEPRGEFANWIGSVIRWRHGATPDLPTRVQSGWTESLQSGVTHLGEIATADWRGAVDSAVTAHSMPPVSGIMFREYLGLDDGAVATHFDSARKFLDETKSNPQLIPGLSPHAPYSVHPELFSGLVQLAQEYRCPVAFHLAESPAELEAIKNGTGPLVELFEKMGVWKPDAIPSGTRPIDFLKQLEAVEHALIIHGNFLSEEEINWLGSRNNMSVVYCPRTHAAMQQGEHPWRKMLAAGVRVMLGTDSRASNPDLSIWRELQFLANHHPEISASSLLSLATHNAASGMGLPRTGRIDADHVADLCVVALGESFDPHDASLFSGNIIAVMKSDEQINGPSSLFQ